MRKVLIIQTAFIGDAILATSAVESVINHWPDAEVHLLVRKGNESLFVDHPHLKQLHVWDKTSKKYRNLRALAKKVRAEKFDYVINLHRFASSGFITWMSKAKVKAGFNKSPFAKFFDVRVSHEIGNGKHEVERNHELLQAALGEEISLQKPRLYPSAADFQKADEIVGGKSTIILAPSSVWFTKQMPKEKWIEIIQQYPDDHTFALIGGAGDKEYLNTIVSECHNKNVLNTAGELSLLESAALISRAIRTHVNDSAPLHLASSMNAAVTAYFCSTIPDFGFGPLSDDNLINQVPVELPCRPCGLHGHKNCPEGHFRCGKDIKINIS